MDLAQKIERNVPIGSIAGGPPNKRGQISIGIDRRRYLIYRLAWFYMTGQWPPNEIDHIDRNPLNNRWNNLRLATRSENGRNRGLSTRNTSGQTGVSWHKRLEKYQAQIMVEGKYVALGYFERIEDAARAYKQAVIRYHGEFGVY